MWFHKSGHCFSAVLPPCAPGLEAHFHWMQQQQLHVCPCCHCSLFRVHSSQPRVYPCAVRDRLGNSFNHLAALKAEHSFHRFWWCPLLQCRDGELRTVWCKERCKLLCIRSKHVRTVELLPSSAADWPLIASWLRSLDVCSSQISDVTDPTAATFVTPLSILPQHLMFPWASRCRLFSPVFRSVSCFNPLPVSSSLSYTLMCSPSHPPLPHVSASLAHRCCALDTEGSCVAEGRGSFFFFLLRCLPLLFHCCRSAGFSHLKVICRWLCKGSNTRARQSFFCFSFFHPVKSFLFFSEFLSCRPLRGLSLACLKVKAAFSYNIHLRLSSLIWINC